MRTLTWVHLSDLHLTIGDSSEWRALRQALLADLQAHQDPIRAEAAPYAGQVLKPDLLFITGDLAAKGKAEEYASVGNLLREIWDITGLTASRTFIVPGNHDVDRALIHEDYPYESTRPTLCDPDLSDQDLRVRLRKFWPSRQSFFKKFTAYSEFVSKTFEQYAGSTYYVAPVQIDGLPPIQVVGLNTAWMADRAQEDARRELLLGLPQFDELVQLMDTETQVIRIALMHHPFDAIHTYDVAAQAFQKHCPIFLQGHRHAARVIYSDEPEREHICIPAGASYQGERSALHAYNFGVLDCSTGQVDIFLRRATIEPTPQYIRDNITYPAEAPDGRIQRTVKRLVMQSGEKSLGKDNDAVSASADENLTPVSDSSRQVTAARFQQQEPRSIEEFLDVIDSNFSFSWERSGLERGGSPVLVYWPVRLRSPTPIHAVQAFAAAGLQRLGANVLLCIDDFGTQDINPTGLLTRVNEWFARVGGDCGALQTAYFTNLLGAEAAPTIWSIVQRWLGTTPYFLERVLRIAKLMPPPAPDGPVEELLTKRPRRLLECLSKPDPVVRKLK